MGVALSTVENRPIILKVCLKPRQRGWVDFSFVLAALFGFRCWQHNPPVILDPAEGSSQFERREILEPNGMTGQ